MAEDKTLTRAHLCDALVREIGLSKHECQDLVESFLGNITGEMEKKRDVKLSGFGTFTLRYKRQRKGRNPKTGEEVPILPRTVIAFKPSTKMKLRINDALLKRDGALND